MRSSLALVAVLAAFPAAADPLVGPPVGNADLLIAEGSRLYNEKDFARAQESFLKATRVNPAAVPVYLSLARAYLALKKVDYACQTYRVFIKNASEGPEREKAQAELDLCERQQANRPADAPPPPMVPLAQTFVAGKAAFYDALDKGVLTGPASAFEQLKKLVEDAYAAPDLGEMAAKLAKAAEQSAEATHKAALRREQKTTEELRRAAGLYQLALDCGALAGTQPARAAFLEGLALLKDGQPKQAEERFAEAAAKDPADSEARFHRALARYSTGDKAGAVSALEADLPGDARTAILKVAVSFDRGPDAAASELEKLLFSRRFKPAP